MVKVKYKKKWSTKNMAWCCWVNILHGSQWKSTTHCFYSTKFLFLWKSIIHQKEIFLSVAWPLSLYSKESFRLYYSSTKYSTLFSVHSALILQILDFFLNQHSSLLCPAVCQLVFWLLHSDLILLLLFSLSFSGLYSSFFSWRERLINTASNFRFIFWNVDLIFSDLFKNYLKWVVCGRMCSLFYTFFTA